MKKLIWIIACGIICLQLAGCSGWLVRTSSSTKVRVDQQVEGNRGFLRGKPAGPPKEATFKERKVYRVEVEVPDLPKKRPPASRKKTSDVTISGNRGYLFGSGPKKEVKKTPIVKIKEKISEVFTKDAPATPCTYKTRKGDTLQKISQKFYGTTKKWALLYRANKDKLKTPDNIRPGQILIIPEVEEFKKYMK